MANVVKLSSQDRKELDKFTKFFAIKIVQVIVQSRLGEKLKTKSKPFSSGVDWFSVTIDDVPEVLAETRKALSGHLPTIGLSLCVEISLKTVEGDTMVLETWCLGMTEQCDVDARVSYTVYNRMAVLLKSLLVVSRVTPAYRLSCRQGPDSYVICYRVYLGEPQYYMLGEGFQEVHVGQVGTPVGTFFLTVTYRTKLTITPQRIERDCPFMVKSDHFKPDLSPRGPHKWPHVDSGSVLDELAAACDECQELGCTPLALNSPNEMNGFHHQHHLPFVEKKSPRSEKENDAKMFGGNDCQSEIKKIGAFIGELRNIDPLAGSEFLMPETAFCSLLQHDQDNNIVHKKTAVNLKTNSNNNNINNNNNNNNLEVIVNGTAHNEKMDIRSENGSHESQKSSSSITSAAMDDFVMVELKTPFASPDPSSDLSAFYRECQSAPPLDSFKNHPTLAEQVNDISNQLAMFEVNMHDFDELVDSLCNSEVWK